MEILEFIRFIVFTISFVMFCYQFNTATLNLMNPGLVDINHEKYATGDDMPLVIVCPTNQTNITRMRELDYDDYEHLDHLLEGSVNCNGTTRCISWGAHANLTFDKLKEQAFDMVKFNRSYVAAGFNITFLPGYGMCKETLFKNYRQEIELWHCGEGFVRAFLTDRNYRSYIMPDTSSHVGKEIVCNPHRMHYFNVQIHERNNCNNNENPMSNEDYKKCVDDKIQQEFKENKVECVPPWLSNNNQCNQTYPKYYSEFYGQNFQLYFSRNYTHMVGMLSNIRFEEECRQSCKETTYVVNEKGAKNSNESDAYITFNEKVIVTEKVLNYDMFKYIIDVGSSMGLWLGLSVLGLHDLVVLAVQFINNSFIIKKIRSAVTK